MRKYKQGGRSEAIPCVRTEEEIRKAVAAGIKGPQSGDSPEAAPAHAK